VNKVAIVKLRRVARFGVRQSMEHRAIRRRELASALGAVGLLLIGAATIAEEPPRLNGIPLRGKSAPFIAYPAPLVRSNVSGRVALAYSIDVDGNPAKIVVFVSDDSRLEGPAVDFLKKYKFDVPKTWESDGGPWRRFHLQVTFAFENDPLREKLVEDGENVTITFRILRGSPGAPLLIKSK
jgi:Gram-negative bacterial TonB protein C-terminal